jgi:hypothetical protein
MGGRKPARTNMNSTPDPKSIEPSPLDFGAVVLPSLAVAAIAEKESQTCRNGSSFFVAIRAFLPGLINDSAYRDVSFGGEISVIFTSDGPLVYQLELSSTIEALR